MSNKKWKMSQNLWPSQNILTFSLIHVYALIVFFSFQKAKVFIHFTGFSIWDWDWDQDQDWDLGC